MTAPLEEWVWALPFGALLIAIPTIGWGMWRRRRWGLYGGLVLGVGLALFVLWFNLLIYTWRELRLVFVVTVLPFLWLVYFLRRSVRAEFHRQP